MSANDALFLSVHAGELIKPMNGSVGIRSVDRGEAEAAWAITANARRALLRTASDESFIP